ncbi:MAG: glycoside hydrolase family 3 N-terminal domain-containing protein [Nocardioides sp.]
MSDLETLALRVQLPGFVGTSYDGAVLDLLHAGLGGVCLFGSNTAAGSERLTALTRSVHDAGPHAVVSVDEEGGGVSRLHAHDGSPVLGAAALGAVDDLALTRATGRAVGAELAAHGIDLDLAPVADVNSCPDNPVIGTRSFGPDAAGVAAHVAAWVGGLQEAGVSACVKHFPGHGDTSEDSHLALPVQDADLSLLHARELRPFAAAVGAGADAVMTSHLLVRALDPQRPATLSPAVLGLLRTELGFDGVLVTDALDMAGASAGRGIPEAAVLSLAAGADLLCLGADKDVELVRDVQAAVVHAVRSGRLEESRLAEAAGRVADLTERRTPGGDAPVDEAVQRRAARTALRIEGSLPDLTGALVVQLTTRASIAVGEVPWGVRPDLTLSPDDDPPPGDGPLVVQVRDAHRQPRSRAFLDRLPVARPTVVVEWGWPAPDPGGRTRICTLGSSRPAVAAVTEVLEGAGWHR